MKLSKKELFSIPNCLSYLRLIMIPIFVYLYFIANSINDYYKAALIIALSGATDIADGYIARRYGLITELGKLLDPIADKLTQGAMLFCLLYRYLWIWPLVTFFIIKEVSMAISSILLFKKGKKLDGAKWFGKLCTFIFYACMVILVAFPEVNQRMIAALIMLVGSFFALSFILYNITFFKMYKSL